MKMSKKQSKLTSLWNDNDSDDSDCMILDPVPETCSTSKKPDISVVKISCVKKANQWVSSAFDGFDDFCMTKSTTKDTVKHLASSTQREKSFPTSFTQREKSVPTSFTQREKSVPTSFTQREKSVPTSFTQREKSVSVKRPHHQVSNGNDLFSTKRTVTRRANTEPDTSLWSEKYAPKCQGDLAVHKKKILEVEQWIKGHIDRKKLPPILLLTGPTGTGKTSTVRVLTKELRCHLHEWSNPFTSDSNDNWSENTDWRNRVDSGISRSQLSQFREFLLRANKYNTLDIFGDDVVTRKIIMVEDFPNMFYKDATPFHDVLRKYVQVGGSPLIFIVSDSMNGESNERLLFPKDLQAQLHIENISFNPVAMTNMTKILNKVASEESLHGSHRFVVPDKCVIESIAMSSSGDIRGAINALQFACLKDTLDLSAVSNNKSKSLTRKKSTSTSKKSTSSKKSFSKTSSFQKDEELMSIGGRDTSLFLFRALGKILYCKRDEPSENSVEKTLLPKHLSHFYRDPLQINPEDVVEKSHLSGDYFGAYLHQNYIEFYNSIDDIVTASEYLSDTDYLTVDWASRSILQHYVVSIATRGLMFSNTSRAKHTNTSTSLGWKPLHKPQWYGSNKLSRQNAESARYLFRGLRSAPVVLQTELIPYISLINTTLHDTGQISLMQELCRFSSLKVGRYEKLDEKDVDLEDDDTQQQQQSTLPLDTDDVISNSQSNVKNSQEQDDEDDVIIDDYDD